MEDRQIAAELAGRALEILRRDGWTKDTGMDEAGRRCLLGAGIRAQAEMLAQLPRLACRCSVYHHWSSEAGSPWRLVHLALARVINEQFPHRVLGVVGQSWVIAFNDHPDTIFADVELVLEKVAAG